MDVQLTEFSSVDEQQLPTNGSHAGFDDFLVDSNYASLLSLLVLIMPWVNYVTYCRPKVLGFFMTLILQLFFWSQRPHTCK
jgi:hypothetical protein